MAASRAARRLSQGLVALVVLAALVGAVLAGLSLRDTARADDGATRAGVLQAARQATLNLFNVGYSTFDRDTKRVLDGATGDFREQFQARLGEYRSSLTSGKWQMKGTVLEAGIQSLDSKVAKVLVAADQTVTGPSAPNGQLSNYRLALTLVRQGDQWRVSTLQMGD